MAPSTFEKWVQPGNSLDFVRLMVPINQTGSGGVRYLGHGHQRVVSGSALLKYGGIFEDPRIETFLPFRVGANHLFRGRKIKVIVGPEIKVGCI